MEEQKFRVIIVEDVKLELKDFLYGHRGAG